MRAILLFSLCSVGCGAEASLPTAADTNQKLCASRSSADLDPAAGSWRLLTPPHGTGGNGQPLTVDAALDSCEALVSVAHDNGPGGKVYLPGPAKLLWSADGETWQARDMGTQAFFRSMAYGAGTWVAVGERMGAGVISMSRQADASQWSEVFQHTMFFRSVAYGAGKFVAVTQDDIAVSSDGEHWQWAQLPDVRSLYFEVAYGGGRFVVAGVGATLTSSDGEHWSETGCGPRGCPAIQPPSGPASTTIALQQMRYVGGAFYATGGSGQLRSRDGLSFEPYAGVHMPDVAVGGKLLSLVQVGGSSPTGLSMSSDDGQSWTDLPLGAASSSADCTQNLCAAAGSFLLSFQPGS